MREPTCTVRFVRTGTFHLQAALGLAIGAVPAVLVAAFIVRSLPLSAVRWLVVIVVVYTAVSMLVTARAEGRVGAEGELAAGIVDA